MADILSQDEVDMLLTAVSDGDIEEDAEAAGRADQPLLSTYDFRRPERVSKEQLKGLQSLFEAFAREMSIDLPPYMRTVVRVDLTSIDQLTYDEFILSVARPTALTVVDMAPLDGKAVLEMSPSMVFPIVDRVLGGKGMALSTPRELTEIENRIIYRIVLMMLDSWKRAWEQLIELSTSVVKQESDPLIVQIVAGSEMVILVGYEVYVGETVGSVNICIPLMVLNPILDQISQQAHFQRRMSPEQAACKPLTPAADWYAVGVMLHESLTGHVPFQGSGVDTVAAKQTLDAPAPSTLLPGVQNRLFYCRLGSGLKTCTTTSKRKAA